MITVVERTSEGAENSAPGGWLGVVAPTPDEIERLSSEFGISQDFVAHALDENERPRAETKDGATLVVIRVPSERAATKDGIPYTTVPLGLILAKRWIAAISAKESVIISRLRTYAAEDACGDKHHRLILHALRITAETYQEHLKTINADVDRLEDSLTRSLANKEVIELLKYQKSLVYFATALRSTELMLERLQRSPAFEIAPEDEGLLEDVLVEVKQAIEVTTVAGNILGEMMDAFTSIISNNLGVVMKFLTAIAVVLTPPVTVASFYGMNVELPGSRSPAAFTIVIGISVAMSIGIAVAFRKKSWL